MKKTIFKLISLVLLAVTLFAGYAWGADKSGNQLTIPDVEYTYFKLENGLQIYVFEDHQVPLVDVAVWYKVGSLDETEGSTGISHLLEHTMFLGTETMQKDQVHQLVRSVGGFNNASTHFEYTKYYETVPSTNLELAVAIEADRMVNLKFDPEEFKREKEVVMQERRRNVNNNVFFSAYEEIVAKAFQKSPLHHQVIGWMDDINHLTVADVKEHYQHYYAPNNAILVVSGDADPQQVKQLAEKYFGDYQPKTITRHWAVEPKQKKERKITVERVTNLPYIVYLYKLPAGNAPDMATVECLLDILVNKPTSRVNRELQQKQEIILGAGAWVNEYQIPGFAQVVLVPVSTGKIQSVELGFDKELHRLIHKGISMDELDLIKKSMLKRLVFAQRNVNDFADEIVMGSINYNDPEFYKKKIERIQNLTPADITRVAKTYFTKRQRTVGYIIPKADKGE